MSRYAITLERSESSGLLEDAIDTAEMDLL